jgi:hypothetical protein
VDLAEVSACLRKPRENSLPVELLVARDLDLQISDSALTTDTPTPCRPPEVS